MLKKIFLVGVLSMGLAVVACGSKSKGGETTPGGGEGGGAAGDKKSLFDRLGGLEGISAVVDLFLQNVAADDRINQRFAATDLPKLRQLLIDQVCAATGGPCEYKGKGMEEAHAGMGVTTEEFTALAEDMVKALDAAGVPQAEKDELMGALAGMHDQIVGK
jgi:hemoglobin